MKISAVTNYNSIQPSKQNNRVERTGYLVNTQKPVSSPNFGILIIDDLFNWGIRQSNKSFMEKTACQIKEIRKQVLDDVELLSKRQGVSREAVKKYYGKDIEKAGIAPKYDGREIGLNKVVGYSLEKFELLNKFAVPILDALEAKQTGKVVKDVPKGLILHGRSGSGKYFFANSLIEHVEEKAKEKDLPLKTLFVTGDWYKGGNKENIDIIQDSFKEVRENSKNGFHTIVFIDKMNELLTSKGQKGLSDELIRQTQHPAKDNFTWVGTMDDIRDLPKPFLRRGRTSLFMEIDKTKSESESQALLKHFITQTGRASEYDEEYIYGYIRNNQIPFIPKKIKQIVRFADDELKMTQDYSSKKKGTYVAPVINMQLMMGADYVSKYNRNKVIRPFDKHDIQIPKALNIDTNNIVIKE